MCAAARGARGIVDVLVASSADLNAQDKVRYYWPIVAKIHACFHSQCFLSLFHCSVLLVFH